MAEIKAKKGESKEFREKKEKKNNSEKLAIAQADFDNYINSPEFDAYSSEYHELLNRLNIAKHRVKDRKSVV